MESSESSDKFFQIVDRSDQPIFAEDSSRLYEAAFDDNLRAAVVDLDNRKGLWLLARANKDKDTPSFRKAYTDAEATLTRVIVGLTRRYGINMKQAHDAYLLCREGLAIS